MQGVTFFVDTVYIATRYWQLYVFVRGSCRETYCAFHTQTPATCERVLPLEFTDIFHAYSHHTVCTLLSVSICFVKILLRSFIVGIEIEG